MGGGKKLLEKIMNGYKRKEPNYDKVDEADSYFFREGPIQLEEEEDEELKKVSAVPGEGEYEILEREIVPRKIICPDCGGITLEGLEFCDKCGGELVNRD